MILQKTLNEKAKMIACGVGIGLVIFLLYGKSEASRRISNRQDVIEKSSIEHTKVNLHGNVFDLYINHIKNAITVQGEIEVYDNVNWNEVEKVKRYFKIENPGNYEFSYEFKFVYHR